MCDYTHQLMQIELVANALLEQGVGLKKEFLHMLYVLFKTHAICLIYLM